MKFKGTLITQASGAAVGLVYSHNRGGAYVRGRSVPNNPQSVFQVNVRQYMADLANRWRNVLTELQREAWDVYAMNVLRPDRLGDSVNIGGIGQYIRSNVPRLQAGLARVDAAPGTFNVGGFTNPSIDAVDAAGDTLDLAFTNTDAWAAEVGSAMLVLVSRPQNVSIKYFKGPYRFAGSIAGALVPPTSPATIALPFPVAVGQRVFIQVRVTRADGRLSNDFRDTGVAA